jgi:hypothetical protein
MPPASVASSEDADHEAGFMPYGIVEGTDYQVVTR